MESLQWTEVTKQYAGLFFRAEGSGSLPFGQTQPAKQSWITEISYQLETKKQLKLNRSKQMTGLVFPIIVSSCCGLVVQFAVNP